MIFSIIIGLFWAICLIALLYVFAGFPLILGLISLLYKKKHLVDEHLEPSVTLIISAYNEAAVINEKLKNCQTLDYPQDKLDILVVSDCSDDDTDSLVLGFQDPRIRLLRMVERKGKTCGLNAALEQIQSELVLFSDANAMYDTQAVRKMVRHFADSRVGYVVGHARYTDAATAAAESENLYWNFEVQLKKWESAVHSVVGGDGAIYMIRRALYRTMEPTDINDFVNPLQIVAAGYRGIFAPDAFCIEAPAADFEKEFGRKVRIVNRSFNGFLRVRQLLNPLQYGMFSWLLFSHKVLRWFSPFLLFFHFFFSLLLPVNGPLGLLGICSLGVYSLLIGLSLLGLLNELHGGKIFSSTKFFYYFILMNAASSFGVISRLQGQKIVTWSTVRAGTSQVSLGTKTVALILTLAGFLLLLRLVTLLPGSEGLLRVSIFFLCLLVAYALIGYPMVLLILRRLLRQPHRIDETYEPTVTLLIPAYNEAVVLAEKLKNSLQLDYPRERLRILVVSDGSTDGTNAIAQEYAEQGVELLPLSSNCGKISAMNTGMKTVKSEITIFSDANVFYSPLTLRKLVRHFAAPHVGGVSGKVMLLNNDLSYAIAENKYYNIEHMVQQIESETGSQIGADGAMYAVRSSLYQYPPPDTVLDDFVISMGIIRQGFRLLHDPEALGHEQNRADMSNEFQRKARIIAGGIQALLRGQAHPPIKDVLNWFKLISHKILRWLLGPMSLSLLLLIIFYMQNPTQLAGNMDAVVGILNGCFLLWFAVVLIPGIRRFTVPNLCYYFLVMLAASLVGCWRGLLGSQPVTWKQSQE